MTKKIAIASILVSTSLLADTFVGIDLFQNNLELGSTKQGKEINFNLKAGVILNDNHRIYINGGKLYDNKGIKYNTYALNYDYLFGKIYTLRPFAGLQVGYDELKVSDESDKAIQYGAKAGILKSIDNHQLEVGIKYSQSNTEIGTTYKIDTISMGYVSYNYKF